MLCWCPYFSSYHLPLQLLTPPHTPCTWACFSSIVFVLLLFLLILPDVDSMHFVTFFTTCETSSMKNCFVLATGRAENLNQVVFRQPFVIQHVRTQSLNCFYILINMKSICDIWCYCFSLCCIRVTSWFESQKCVNKPRPRPCYKKLYFQIAVV